MPDDLRILQPVSDPRDPRQVADFTRRVAGLVMPEPTVAFDVGDEAANTVRVTITAADLRAQEWTDVWRVEFYLSTSPDGPPVATGHTFTIITGEITETILAGSHYRATTDVNGVLVFDLEISGPATRYVVVKIAGRKEASEALEWA